jgi:ATP-dependent protease ClpP protease subunit
MINNNAIEYRLSNIHEYGLDIDNREVYLHSFIDTGNEEGGVDYRVAINFEKNIRYLNTISADPIIVHMHLPGGDWTDCLGIYDTIIQSKAPIAIIAYAKAESSSGIIFQAPKLRILMPNSYVLIHYGFLSLDGEHKAAISNIQWNEKEAKKMLDIFTEKCLDSPIAKEREWKKSSVKKYISSQLSQKSDWILDASEAVYNGFADGIYGQNQFASIESIKRKLSK